MANEKFCGSCGAKMSADAGFCPVCGAKQSAPAPAETVQASAPVTPIQTKMPATVQPVNNGGVTEPAVSPDTIKKMLPFIGIGAAVIVVIIVAAVIIVNATKWTKIDPAELCRLDCKGADGSGTASAAFAFDKETTFYIDEFLSWFDDDEDVLKAVSKASDKDIKDALEEYAKSRDMSDKDFEKYMNERYKDLKTSKYLSNDEDELAKAFKKAKDEDEAEEMKSAILDSVEFKISGKKKTDLKNGDKVKVKVDFDEDDLEEYNIKLTSDEFTLTVSGLAKTAELDPFKDVKVTYEGISGKGYANLDTESVSDDIKEKFYFQFNEYYSELSNGDTVEVKASYSGYQYDDEVGGIYDEEKNVYYLIEEETVKSFTVEGLKELETVEVFDYIELVYEGVAPDVSVSLEWKEDTPDYIKDNTYVSANTWNMEVYDGATFTAEASAYYSFEEAGYKLATEEKTFTISLENVERYITAEDVTFDMYADIFKEKAEGIASSYVGSEHWDLSELGKIESIVSVTHSQSFVKINNDQFDWWDPINKYNHIYEVKCKHSKSGVEADGVFYIVTWVNNITVADGKMTEFTVEDVNTKTYDTKEEVIKGAGTTDDSYVCTEVK